MSEEDTLCICGSKKKHASGAHFGSYVFYLKAHTSNKKNV